MSIDLIFPTDQSPVKLVIKFVKVLPADQCLQLYNITFRRYVDSMLLVLFTALTAC